MNTGNVRKIPQTQFQNFVLKFLGIPSPTKLSLDRQFTNSALISWRGAQLPNDEIQGYNIYVDGEFKTQVKGSKKTNAVVEDIKPTEVGIRHSILLMLLLCT